MEVNTSSAQSIREGRIQKLTDDGIKALDEALKAKEAEIKQI